MNTKISTPTLNESDKPSTGLCYQGLPDDGILNLGREFRSHWRTATDDSELSLFCFRRFRTGHLLNLRFLENEITRVDHEIYQAGLQIEIDPGSKDKVGLRNATRDANVLPIEEIITRTRLQELRALLKEYDDTIISFNKIMNLQTIALSDSNWLSSLRTDINNQETFKTRLLRVDLPPSTQRDPVRYFLHRWLRKLWFQSRVKTPNPEATTPNFQGYRNSIRIADILARFIFALLAGAFLIVPLVVLSYQLSLQSHLVTVSICILAFSILLSLVSQASNQETVMAVAAYAAVLVVFVASTPTNTPSQ
ncbi:hypothetical protein LOCC1_G004289 [Lachnellula occidentalis]|uniref:DUF6594 domain-containing protein n=1 Tax=Lachnellula occidentalis TaxID=215460 RepID=A0A8H8RUF5_9HELO|nr:hypothetical protein LOCC1_G004289 [Lachnellula occidentalis]